MRLIIIVILILLLLGALPTWPYSTGWGYYPVGGLGLVLLIVIILALLGRQFPGSLLGPDTTYTVPTPGGGTDTYVQPAAFRSLFAGDRMPRPNHAADRPIIT